VIAGYFVTSRGNEALVVNNFYYRYQSISKDQKIKKWVCMTDRCSCSISWCDDKVVKINGEKVSSDFNGAIPPQLKKSGMTTSDIASIMSQYYSIKSAMYRSKSLNYPKIPDTLESLNFFTDACKIYREILQVKLMTL
jgi:hypothetical protein